MGIEHSTISILIPAYNAAATLGETLRSSISQKWPHKEITVVDDGSTDQTRAIARRYGVSLADQHNRGAAAARNLAFDLSRGDYIQYLDADDMLAPDKIERQVKALAGCGPRTLASGSFEPSLSEPIAPLYPDRAVDMAGFGAARRWRWQPVGTLHTRQRSSADRIAKLFPCCK